MSTLAYILIATFLGSIVALIGGVILLFNENFTFKISHLLASFAAGVLLGTAFFDLLPEASRKAEGSDVNIFFWTLAGIIIFFLMERFIHWFHHHEEYHEHTNESKSTVPLIVVGDTLHNFLDGVVIAATFLASIPLGILTTLAVFAHEVPQEIGDFGLLVHKRLNRSKIIWINVLSAAASLVGAMITYVLGNILEPYIPVFLSITAGFFIYIATSDLIPEIHFERRRNFAIWETGLLIFGIFVIFITVLLLEH